MAIVKLFAFHANAISCSVKLIKVIKANEFSKVAGWPVAGCARTSLMTYQISMKHFNMQRFTYHKPGKITKKMSGFSIERDIQYLKFG